MTYSRCWYSLSPTYARVGSLIPVKLAVKTELQLKFITTVTSKCFVLQHKDPIILESKFQQSLNGLHYWVSMTPKGL